MPLAAGYPGLAAAAAGLPVAHRAEAAVVVVAAVPDAAAVAGAWAP